MCELREVARGRAGFGKEGTGSGSKPVRNTKEIRQSLKKCGRGHPAMPACGLNACSGPEQSGILSAIPDSLPPQFVSSQFLGPNRQLTTSHCLWHRQKLSSQNLLKAGGKTINGAMWQGSTPRLRRMEEKPRPEE